LVQKQPCYKAFRLFATLRDRSLLVLLPLIHGKSKFSVADRQISVRQHCPVCLGGGGCWWGKMKALARQCCEADFASSVPCARILDGRDGKATAAVKNSVQYRANGNDFQRPISGCVHSVTKCERVIWFGPVFSEPNCPADASILLANVYNRTVSSARCHN